VFEQRRQASANAEVEPRVRIPTMSLGDSEIMSLAVPT